MIPVSLQLKNFLSYGEDVPALDFTEFDVACLSGENGHGKSAILDAITWALWGEARKASADKTPSDGLLRIGTTDMQVEFVFDLEGDRYRVLRKYQRKKGKAGSPSLEFQIFDGASQAYKSVSERTVKNTQEKITHTLRMSYETFINSAFILQGHIDEFTRRSPTQRKTILADILDLSRYEALRELARDHTSAARNERDKLDGQIASKKEEVGHKGEYARKLRELQDVLTEVDDMLGEHEQRKQALEQQRIALQTKQQQLDDRCEQQQHLRQECQQLDQRIARQEEQLKEAQAILRNEGEILTHYKRYSSLQTKSASYEEKRRQLTIIQEQQRAIEQTIRQTQHELEKTLEKRQSEQVQLHAQLADIQHVLDRSHEIEQGFQELQRAREQEEFCEQQRNRVETVEQSIREVERRMLQQKTRLEGEIQSAEQQYAEVQRLANLEKERTQQVERQTAELARLTALEHERDLNKETGMQCSAQIEGLKAQQQRFQQDLADLQEKIDILKRSAQPQCPLCQSALDPQKKQEIDAHFQQENTRLRSEISRIEQELQTHNTRIQELRDQFKRLEKQMKQLQPIREQLIHAEHALLESQQAAACLPALLKQATTLRARLQDNAYAPDEQRQLTALQQTKTDIGYDPQAHQRLKQTIKALQKFQGEYSKLEDTRARQQKLAAQLPDLEQRVAELRETLTRQAYAQTDRDQLHAVLANIQELGYDEQAHADIQQELHQLQQAPTQKAQLDQAQKSAGILHQEMDHLLSERLQKAEQLADLNRRLVELEQALEGLPAIVQELRDHTEALQGMRKKRDALLQEQGTHQHKYDHCQALEVEMAKEQETFNRWQKDVQLYEHLAKMFGKDGIQAYLIDHAIPEIEEEANVILSRLSENRMRIAIESVKDLQSGGSKETLDIKISDEVGTRNYEMYSGGEAFRVDFAIRVALSKLLATRAGTQLRTLVIDEGFGTQDARGLEQLVEAIKAISSDFEKILVITHLDALKEAFPVRIEVVKLPDTGSQYQIVH